ncbi:MAG: hypothetical protein AAGK71_09905 [Pseudomonadota bacterium]
MAKRQGVPDLAKPTIRGRTAAPLTYTGETLGAQSRAVPTQTVAYDRPLS